MAGILATVSSAFTGVPPGGRLVALFEIDFELAREAIAPSMSRHERFERASRHRL